MASTEMYGAEYSLLDYSTVLYVPKNYRKMANERYCGTKPSRLAVFVLICKESTSEFRN